MASDERCPLPIIRTWSLNSLYCVECRRLKCLHPSQAARAIALPSAFSSISIEPPIDGWRESRIVLLILSPRIAFLCSSEATRRRRPVRTAGTAYAAASAPQRSALRLSRPAALALRRSLLLPRAAWRTHALGLCLLRSSYRTPVNHMGRQP